MHHEPQQLREDADALRERLEQTEFAMMVARVGVSYRDADSNHILLSASLVDLLGLLPESRSIDRSEFIARIHPDDVERVRGGVAAAVAGHGRFSLEYRFHHPARGWRWFQSEGQVTSSRPGESPRVFSAIVDVTERRLLEQQLFQAQKMEAIGKLAGGVAHDFNNLLTAISGYSRLLLESVGTEGQRSDVEEIIKAADRAASLTTQLLSFSRQQILETVAVDLNDLIEDIAAILRRIIGDDVELITILKEVSAVRGDRGQLEQVVLNLVVNARDAMPGGGTIRIETHETGIHSPLTSYGITLPPGRYVVMTVSDTGCGMSEETKARLFEPFFTTKPQGVGTGLGLATIHGILAQSGGLAEVSSEPGAGASFRVYLPQYEGVIATAPRIDLVLPAGGSETILLAEDEASVRVLARRILQRAGYTVIEARNSVDAKHHAESTGHIDLLLADVRMPGGGGPDLYRSLHASRPTMRVLFMSGYAERHLFERAEIPHAAPFLSKPFTMEGLLRKVREALA